MAGVASGRVEAKLPRERREHVKQAVARFTEARGVGRSDATAGAPCDFLILRYGRPEPDALMHALVPAGALPRTASSRSVSPRAFPETATRAEDSLKRARRQPRGVLHKSLKRQLYALQYNAFRVRMSASRDMVAVVWNGLTGTRLAFAAAARDARRPCLFVERAPLPGRLTVDPQGVNAASSLPRDPGFYRQWAARTQPPPAAGWRRLGTDLVARSARRSGIGQTRATSDLAAQRFLFCPLQVQDDTQVTRFSGWCDGMDGFLAALSDAVENLPSGWSLRVKEHPSSRRSLAPRLTDMQARHGDRLVVDNRTDTFEQVAASRGVVTLNSSVGLQAFFHDKPVVVLGDALFRIPGVVRPADGPEDLAALFAQPDDIGFDPDLRDAFMRYLDEVYYPPVTTDATGRPFVDPARIAPKIAAARAIAAGHVAP